VCEPSCAVSLWLSEYIHSTHSCVASSQRRADRPAHSQKTLRRENKARQTLRKTPFPPLPCRHSTTNTIKHTHTHTHTQRERLRGSHTDKNHALIHSLHTDNVLTPTLETKGQNQTVSQVTSEEPPATHMSVCHPQPHTGVCVCVCVCVCSADSERGCDGRTSKMRFFAPIVVLASSGLQLINSRLLTTTALLH